VDRGQDTERLAHRQVPPQLRALAEHHPDLPCQPPPVRYRAQPAREHAASGGYQDSGEHLDGGRLPGAVRADVAHGLAGLDRDGEAVDRGEQPPTLPVAYPELAGEAVGLDDRAAHPPPPW
jgi:hypothetical protein